MPFIAAIAAIVISIGALLVLIVRFKVHPFIAMALVAIALGVVFQVPLIGSVEKASSRDGIFTVLLAAMNKNVAHILILVGLGCVIGEIITRSGTGELLGRRLLSLTGPRRGVLALVLAGVLVGMTIFFDTAVILLAPVAIAVARQSGRNAAVMAVPMAIAVLAVHAIVPPHPGAVAVAGALGADYGLLIIIGLATMLPGAALGCWWAYTQAGRLENQGLLLTPGAGVCSDPITTGTATGRIAVQTRLGGSGKTTASMTMPDQRTQPVAGLGRLITVLLLPIALILVATVVGQLFAGQSSVVTDALQFVGIPEIALIITTVVAFTTLLPRSERKIGGMAEVGRVGLRPVGEIVLSTAGGIAFGGIIAASGIGQSLVGNLQQIQLPLVVFGFILALVLRATLGTTTAAVTTVATLLAGSIDLNSMGPVHIVLLAIGISAGGVCLSHVNDAGFWVLSRYFTISEVTMLRTWTVGVTIMGFTCVVLTTIIWFVVPILS